MNPVLIGMAGLLLAAPAAVMQDGSPPAYGPPPGYAPTGACEVRPDAPYVNPRLPLGRAAYAQRPACRTAWAAGPDGPALYVQGPPVQVEGPPVAIGGLKIYLVPPEIIVFPSPVTIEPPQVQLVPTVAEPSADR